MRGRPGLGTAALLAVLVMVLPAPAAAADPEQVAEEVGFRGYSIESGVELDFEALEELIVRHPDVYFVALAADPAEGTDRFAAEVLDRLESGTVVVVSPGEVGAVSSTLPDGAVGAALDASIGRFDTGLAEGFTAFADALSAQTGEPGGSDARAGSGVAVVVIIGVVVAVVGFVMYRNSRRDREAAEGRLEQAKAELGRQVDAVANAILDLSDRVTVADDSQATDYYRSATETFAGVQETIEGATTVVELEELCDRLDRARWQLEATESVLEGRPIPPEPQSGSGACFFDPTHKAGVESAEVRTGSGTKQVEVCRDCAETMRQGGSPEMGEIQVGRRKVPAPQAPRSHGGRGFDWLGAFSMVLSGLPDLISYNRRGRPRRGGWGGSWFPGGGRSAPGSTAPPAGSGRRRRQRDYGRARRRR